MKFDRSFSESTVPGGTIRMHLVSSFVSVLSFWIDRFFYSQKTRRNPESGKKSGPGKYSQGQVFREKPQKKPDIKTAFRSSEGVIINERVFGRWDYVVFGILTLVNATAVVLFASYWFSLEGWTSSILLWIATLLLVRNLFVYQLRWFSLLLMEKPVPRPARKGWKVAAVTTFVPGPESQKMLERTVRALVAMKYPHETWVLDEGESEEVRAFCTRIGAHYFSRKNKPHYNAREGTFQTRSKHGNYNAWLNEIGFESYDIIAAFDPDHIPVSDYLLNVLGYFDDPGVGYVQTPQAYYNQHESFIARGAAEETYAFYSVIQMAYYAIGQPIVTGSHNVHRVSALREVGGFAAHEADDLLITLHYRAAGWRGVYVPRILARGLTPVDWSTYLNQQLRWARSVLDIKMRKLPILLGRLSFSDRVVGILHGIYYLQGLTALFGVLLLIYMLATSTVPSFFTIQTLVYLILIYLVHHLTNLFTQRFYLDRRNEWGLHLRGRFLQLSKWPYFLLAFVQVLLGHNKPYYITLKVRDQSKKYTWIWPHVIVTSVVILAWIFGTFTGESRPTVLHFLAFALVGATIGLIWTETWNFPEPYDRKVKPKTSRKPR